jgi:hypothetical protein
MKRKSNRRRPFPTHHLIVVAAGVDPEEEHQAAVAKILPHRPQFILAASRLIRLLQ